MTTTTAKKATPVQEPVHVPTVWELDLGSQVAVLFDDLSAARQDRLAAERKEKPLKAAAKALWEGECEDLEQGDTLKVLTAGELQGNVIRCPNPQPDVDFDLLLQAFPEAYQACVKRGTHLRFNPA
jgi:hypothetical protein